MSDKVLKILRRDELIVFQSAGVFSGSSDDRRDGFVHLSTLKQVPGTLARHFTSVDGVGEAGLSLASFVADELGDALRWEVSRDGDRFPHFYGDLQLDKVRNLVSVDVDSSGTHVIPDGVA